MKILNRLLKKRRRELSERDLKGQAEKFTEKFVEKQQLRAEKERERQEKLHAKDRQSNRQSCFSVAALGLPDQRIEIEGLVTDISARGVTFRPASHYLMVRDGQPIHLAVEGITRTGVIRSSRPDGYGIQVLEPYSEDDIDRVLKASLNPNMFEGVAA